MGGEIKSVVMNPGGHGYVVKVGDSKDGIRKEQYLVLYDNNGDGIIDDINALGARSSDSDKKALKQYGPEAQALVTQFRAELPQQLAELKQRLAGIIPIPHGSSVCGLGTAKEPRMGALWRCKGRECVQDLNGDGKTDRVVFETRDGIPVHISDGYWYKFYFNPDDSNGCMQINLTPGLAVYLKVFD